MSAADIELRWVPLGTLLVSAGLLTPEQLEHALVVKETRGGRLGRIVVELGFATERSIAGALAEQYALELVDLEETPPDPDAIALLPEELARRYEAIPIRFLTGGQLLLGVADPTDVIAADDIKLALGTGFQLAVVDPSQLGLAQARAYRRPLELVAGDAPRRSDDRHVDDIRDAASSVPTINLVNRILSTAVEEGASDIHLEPQRDRMLVRARIDGMMRELASVPKHMQAAVTSRLKIMGGLDISDRRAPQDGRVSVHFGGDPIDLRIAVVPTTDGEQVVLRLVNRRNQTPTLADLEMSLEAERAFLEAIEQPYGAVIVCGPTGSGKTTTLYGALGHLNKSDRVLMTIEDPVEHQVDGVNQVEVEPRAGLTFARGLRTILRSDPDILLVGEIRDEETASIAIQAALTGHLLLTSLHAHNAAAAIARLRDMGVPPGLLASTLNCIVAQRLARRLCEHCKAPYEAAPSSVGLEGDSPVTLYRPTGCVRCGGAGYLGRIALREVMPVHGEVRRLVESSTEEIFAAAIRQGMTTLRADGMRLCLAGLCSLEEVRRVTGDRLA
jgi:type IV pilus assembly protein PilB